MIVILFACVVENSNLTQLSNALKMAKEQNIYNTDDFFEFQNMIENRIIELTQK